MEHEDGRLRLPRHWRPVTAAAALAGYMLTANRMEFAQQLGHSRYNTLMAAVCALLLALVVLAPREHGYTRLVRALESRVLVGAGVIS